MKKFNSIWAILVLFLCVTSTSMAQLKIPAVVGDTLWQTDFKLRPGAYTAGDVYTVSSTASSEKTLNTVIFGNGASRERININLTQSANQFGSTATVYVSQTAADDGATSGAFSFLAVGTTTTPGGGYIITPQVQGPCDISVWACSGLTYSQTYDVYFSENGGAFVKQGTATVGSDKKIKKNVFSYAGSGLVNMKLVCGSTQSSGNTNLYIYNVVVLQAAPPTTPSIAFISGSTAQTVYQTQTIKPIVYQYGGTATSSPIAWTGTADANTAPNGVIVTNNTSAKTVTISGALNALGSYGYSITSTDGTNTTAALTGTLNTKTTTKYKMAFVTTVTSGAPAALDLNFINGLSNNPGNDGFSKDFDLTYISSIDTGIDYSIYDLIVQSSIPSSSDGGLAELKTKCLSKPFVNMKAFQLQSSRWNWLTPSNNTTLNTITVPDSAKLHPLYNGITFTGAANNEIQLTTLTTGNMLVTSAWLTTTTASANPRVLATAQALPSAYDYMEIPVGTTMNGMTSPTTAKQMILGLSEATYGALTANAVTLAVNAAKYVVAPTISLTSGTNAQTLHANASIANVVYTYSGTVTATNVVWTGTANASTPPAGITVTVDAVAKTITISGAPTAEGAYGYTVSATDGAAVPALTGTITVSIGTGVQNTFNAKTVVTTEFFDVTGKKVSEYSHGLLIEKTIYSDGSVSFNKIYRAEF